MKRENKDRVLRCYNVIFHDSYNFQESAKSFEQILLRLDRLYFLLLYSDSKLIPMLLTIDDSPKIEIFNNLKHITLEEIDTIPNENLEYKYYAVLKYRKNIAIPFTDVIEPSPLYRLGNSNNRNNDNNNNDDNTDGNHAIVFINARHKQYNHQIASYLKKHEKVKDSIYYAYEGIIKGKLRAKHFLTRIVIASNNRDAIKSIALAFKDFKIAVVGGVGRRGITINNQHQYRLFDRPKYSLFHKDNVLSHIKLLSLLLPDDIDNSRLMVDGVRPYTTSDML